MSQSQQNVPEGFHTAYPKAISAFDALNEQDPNKEDWQGKSYPKELLYAQRMSDCLQQFHPDASESVYLAARCQHIQRWTIPRQDYPMDKQGYKRWRTSLAQFHAKVAADVLLDVGYEQDMADRVADLLQKKRLKRDPEAQLLEDVICLVFMQYYFEDFAKAHDEEKIIDIVRKTWNKMSESGHAGALKIDFSADVQEIIAKALNSA